MTMWRLHCLKKNLWRRIVTKSLAHMAEQVRVPRAENKAAAELKRVAAEAKLPMTRAAGPSATDNVRAAKEVEQISRTKPCRSVRLPFFINEQWELDPGFVTELSCVPAVAESHRCQACPGRTERFLIVAQLGDMLAAEYSSIVTEKDEDCRTGFPERAQTCRVPVGIGKRDLSE